MISLQVFVSGDDWRAAIKSGEYTCRIKLKDFVKGPAVDEQGKIKEDDNKKKDEQ